MLLLSALLATAIGQAAVPPVPGLCSAPVPADRETPGCYKTGEIDLNGAPRQLYWHVYEADSLEAAEAEARNHAWATVAEAHSRTWLYVLGGPNEIAGGGAQPRAVIGPLTVPVGPATAHFSEAIFPPGMRTRVHAHPGPEAFFVVEGEQCMESPSDRRRVGAGETYIVPGGPHLQAAPNGRRNLVLIIAPADVPFVVPGGEGWAPSTFCDF